MHFFKEAAAAAFLTTIGLAGTIEPAAALDLIPQLPCAFPSTHTGTSAEPFCFSVHNTCNTAITSTVRDQQTGEEQDTAPIPAGESRGVCGPHPFALVGHTITGP